MIFQNNTLPSWPIFAAVWRKNLQFLIGKICLLCVQNLLHSQDFMLWKAVVHVVQIMQVIPLYGTNDINKPCIKSNSCKSIVFEHNSLYACTAGYLGQRQKAEVLIGIWRLNWTSISWWDHDDSGFFFN